MIKEGGKLRFERIEVGEREARVVYDYTPEGVRADVTLAADGADWKVVATAVVER